MKRSSISLCIVFLVLCFSLAGPFSVWAQQLEEPKPCLPVRDVPPHQVAFQEGEQLTMVASYKWGLVMTDVGTVSLSLTEERNHPVPQFFAQAEIRTARFFNAFFKVEDHYESRFNVTNMRPTHFMRTIKENKYRIENHYKYLPDGSIDARIVRKGGIQDTLLPGRICTFDFVTLIYFLRNLDFEHMKVGQVSPISFAVDDGIFELYLHYEGKEEKKIQGLGTFRCLKFAAQTVAGVVFDGKEDLLFWFSDDRNHIPLFLESPVVIGRVMGRLQSYDNLRFPLTSKIDK